MLGHKFAYDGCNMLSHEPDLKKGLVIRRAESGTLDGAARGGVAGQAAAAHGGTAARPAVAPPGEGGAARSAAAYGAGVRHAAMGLCMGVPAHFL